MKKQQSPAPLSSAQELELFLSNAKQLATPTGQQGRLIFSLDATYSRQATWDTASQVQGEMFTRSQQVGRLSVQLCYFQGFDQFSHTDWLNSGQAILNHMARIHCLAGRTQIARLLNHALLETQRNTVQAVVFIGDAMEENADKLCELAGRLGLFSTPVFVFQEGNDLVAKRIFKKIAYLSGGAYCRFDHHSADLLKQLLCAVAVFTTGGRHALEDFSQNMPAQVKRLTQQLNK